MNVSVGATPEKLPVMIDGGNRTCAALLIDLRYHIAGLRPGTVIHLVATDPAAPIDLPAWCYLRATLISVPWKGRPGDPPTRCASAPAAGGPSRAPPGVWPRSGPRHDRAVVNAGAGPLSVPQSLSAVVLLACGSRRAGGDHPVRVQTEAAGYGTTTTSHLAFRTRPRRSRPAGDLAFADWPTMTASACISSAARASSVYTSPLRQMKSPWIPSGRSHR